MDAIVAHWAVARPELDVSGLKVFGRLHRSFLVYKSRIAPTFEEHGINDSGFDVLACLRRAVPHHRLTAGELADQTLVTTGGLSLRVNRLEQAGLVTRSKDSQDARVVYVELTPAGAALVDSVADAHFAKLRAMLGDLDTGERETLARLLARLEHSARAAEFEDSGTGVGVDSDADRPV
ncbi:MULTISPECIES: MarR family winged helix-turn-helix transcriptional regulator [Rhodococcus]|uniref:MarR family transcriptional regulator n=1 Tax=Rhodococcus aetherivorans TaxID=191292 RepID=A0A059MIM2_9NOCA|nr:MULTISPECIES: MarR family transcriptional regulator [Rhodococcus]ANZ23307.1 MarR family transcriptional regulator [Rhodococcus sp. WB1]KDE10948.1 MarR family transcriptional regulator [Rhodococcus aetherivorans]MBC2589777.1 MarR family transcriptional regulator [Rhodococcus aetherivorans]MDV6295791.1 MarR family transcriptional regulator [Rhodococcus aetherivorans]OLL19421.1 MarR family transcriptional regulator [Rhodococcus sp. M8]